MSVDEQHVAFPKLYKSPAYARPPAPVEESDRPFDPDELPLLAEQTPEERATAEALVSGAVLSWPVPSATSSDPWAGAYLTPTAPPVSAGTPAAAPAPTLAARQFSIRSFTDRIRRRPEGE